MTPLDTPSPGSQQASTANRTIDIAFADYDRTRPLIDGRVKAKGLALNATNKWVGDFCHRPVYEEFDAAEISLSWYVAAVDKGEPCIAIPIFPLRDPMWAFMYTRTDSAITEPKHLAGKRIGVMGYRYTVFLWLRGLLQEFYGFSPESATWITGEPEGAGYVIPKGIPFEMKPGKSPEDKLRDGEVDAIWAPRVPAPFQKREPWIRRLFTDAQGEMQRFYKRTGILPFSHTIVMKKTLAQQEPWIAQSLYDAFCEAQRVADEVCNTEKMVSYVDSMFILEQQQAAWGANPFVQGLGADNRRVMETFVRYAHEQGYISRRLPVEELFVPVN
jgi:4,5-dihydroxyphthalate decarboxylase